MTGNEASDRSDRGRGAGTRGHPRVRRLLRPRTAFALSTFLLVAAAAGCGEAPDAGDEGAAGDERRVYFEQPDDGDTVTPPVEVVFGSDNVEIGAVPDEFESPREGVVHYHLGYDTECLPPGTVVPEADPWIHFGDGSDRIEMELEPGERLLTVQAGDDEHRTIEGLCETISVTVEESG